MSVRIERLDCQYTDLSYGLQAPGKYPKGYHRVDVHANLSKATTTEDGNKAIESRNFVEELTRGEIPSVATEHRPLTANSTTILTPKRKHSFCQAPCTGTTTATNLF